MCPEESTISANIHLLIRLHHITSAGLEILRCLIFALAINFDICVVWNIERNQKLWPVSWCSKPSTESIAFIDSVF